MELVIATTNTGKFLEIQKSLQDFSVTCISLKNFSNVPVVIEDQPTFEGNALKKARTIVKWIGKPTLADDSGLVVKALDGALGVYSARYAGPEATDKENRKKLLAEMQNIPNGQRQAAFVCALALVFPDRREWVVEGRCEGEISFQEKGSLGFGYDPLFYLPLLGQTMAELPLEKKNVLSHRGRALQKIKEFL